MERLEDGCRIQVFKRHGAWLASINGDILPATWNSKGAADAGASVELRRMRARLALPLNDGKHDRNA